MKLSENLKRPTHIAPIFLLFALSACSRPVIPFGQWDGGKWTYCQLGVDYPKALDPIESRDREADARKAQAYEAEGKLQEAIWLYELHPEYKDSAQRLKDRLADILRSDHFNVVNESIGGTTTPTLLEFDESIRAVFKEEIFNPEKKHNSPDNEVIAYKVDQLLGFGLVPMTIKRQINGKNGSLQYFVKNAVSGSVSNVTAINFRKMRIFDFIIDMNDRYVSNFLYSANENTIVAIDHGMRFQACGDLGIIYQLLQMEPSIQGSLNRISDGMVQDQLGIYPSIPVLAKIHQLKTALKFGM
jgi:hypothetical protein